MTVPQRRRKQSHRINTNHHCSEKPNALFSSFFFIGKFGPNKSSAFSNHVLTTLIFVRAEFLGGIMTPRMPLFECCNGPATSIQASANILCCCIDRIHPLAHLASAADLPVEVLVPIVLLSLHFCLHPQCKCTPELSMKQSTGILFATLQ